MDSAQASRLVAKLRALSADRAATDAEKALAHAKANELSARFRLGVAEETGSRPRARRRYRTRRVRVVTPDSGLIFNASRGKESPTAQVKHQWGDWKITIDVGWRIEPDRASRPARSRRGI
jgi:hypothetical protein